MPRFNAHTVAATYLAFDDTDSPEGMCTTYLATQMIAALRGWDLIGLPRLVRLNPNVPWKTRGNAAVCLAVGKGSGRQQICGAVEGRRISAYERGHPVDPQEVLRIASEVLEANAEFSCSNTNPGIVCSNRRPPKAIYWRAVRGLVDLPAVEGQLKGVGAAWKGYKNGRGVIGASAAMSWSPHDRSWEVISYRTPDRVGTPRDIDAASVIAMDRNTAQTFHNYDYDSGHIAIAPASPCPVLFGIRGDSPEELLAAKDMIVGETPSSWLLYLTNQGTDDHIAARRVRSLEEWVSARLSVDVIAPPRAIKGGHVIVRVSDGQEIDAMFYEPSGALRMAARELLPGDRIVLFGSYRGSPRGFNVEKMQVIEAPSNVRKMRNPLCSDCDKRMGSLGHGQGYRCKVCGRRASQDDAEYVDLEREVRPGWYEPPIASRRHLYRPIRRMSKGTSTTY